MQATNAPAADDLSAYADTDTAELKSRFLAMASHEMRTPMQAIYGLLELIADDGECPPHIHDMARTACTSAAGLLEILDDILDLAKMDAARLELDIYEVPLRTLISGVVEALSVNATGKDITLNEEVDEDVPAVITGDPKRLRQILINLTGNALKFTERGRVSLRVMTRCTHLQLGEGQSGLRFEVADTGIGIPPDVARRLFQAFTQADTTIGRDYGGTGLGLSICRRLVELMGGQIGVDSEVGAGSTFWFEIPAEPVDPGASALELPDLSGISVLSVEDHPRAVKEILHSLKSMGAHVESAQDYASAMKVLDQRNLEVALIDHGLPDGNGLDLIRHVIRQSPATSIIMYTAREDPGLRQTLQALGVPYLGKPASRLGLGMAVRDAAHSAAAGAMRRPGRILIAEDNPSTTDLLKRQLDKMGLEADFAADGKDALQAFKTGEYGLVLTDLHMPGMNGYELVSAIREDSPDLSNKDSCVQDGEISTYIPVILFTADVQLNQRQLHLRHGFDECLIKPVTLGQLRRLFMRWGLMGEESPGPVSKTGNTGSSDSLSPAADPSIDMAQLEGQLGTLDDSAFEMMEIFIETADETIRRLCRAHEHNDIVDVGEAAHSLKGAARTACCPFLGNLAARLQDMAEKGEYPDALIDSIVQELDHVRLELKRLMDEGL